VPAAKQEEGPKEFAWYVTGRLNVLQGLHRPILLDRDLQRTPKLLGVWARGACQILKRKVQMYTLSTPSLHFFFHLVSALHAFVLWAFGNVRWSLTSLYIIKKLMPVDNFLWQ
jgi:hypothetical protein